MPRLCAPLLFLLAAGLAAAAPDPFAEVVAAPVKTSIYIGSVTLIASPFRREGDRFLATYQAKVFPFFFADESGRLIIVVPPADLARIAARRPIAFAGKAIRADGAVRSVQGTAVPTSSTGGKLTVKIHVTRRITLSFNTTYTLPYSH